MATTEGILEYREQLLKELAKAAKDPEILAKAPKEVDKELAEPVK